MQSIIRPANTWVRLVIIATLTFFYVLLFEWLYTNVGLASAALIAIPVSTMGWFFGPKVGLIAGFVGIIVNTILSSLVQDTSGVNFLLIMGWPGIIMVPVAGYFAGLVERVTAERAQKGFESSSHERFVSIMGLATRAVLDPKTADEKYYYLVNHLANLFVPDTACILQWNAVQGKMFLLATTKPLEGSIPNIVLEPGQITEDTVLLENDQALVMCNEPKLSKVIDFSKPTEFSLPANSLFAVPLTAGGYKFGAIIFIFKGPHYISRSDVVYAQLTGSQVALALWTAEQDAQIKKQLREANTLARIERALSETEQVGLEKVLQLIVDSAKELIPGTKQAVLHLIDSDDRVLVPRAVSGLKSSSRSKINMRFGEGVAGQVIATGKSISISDVRNDSRFIQKITPVKYRSLIVAPIKSHDRVIGTISIDSDLSNAFTPDDSRLLDALGVQAAIAIENANLLETTREDLQEINILYQISRGLVATDPDQLMQDVADLLRNIFGFYHNQIIVVNPQTGDLEVRKASGENAAALMEKGHRMVIGTGIVGHVAELGEPFVTNNVDAVVFFVRNPLLPDTQSELSVPIKINNQVLGVLDIQEKPPRRFSQRQMKLLVAVADQLAVALQKANLYQELQTSLRQEKAMHAQLIQSERLAVVGRLLATVSHELNNPLQAIQNALFLLKGEEQLSPQGKQDLDVILSETERMASLIERLRSAYRPGRVKDFRSVELNNLIEEVHTLIASFLRQKQIAFELHPDPGLLPISGMSDQMRQVLLNLFFNAIEVMNPGGRIIVWTRNLIQQNEVLLTVKDTGPGIDPEILPKIFDAFITDKQTGTGLGLMITRDIIEQHFGRIEAENDPEGGAVFNIWLPIDRKGRE